jgi:hypothetical protein
MNIGKLPETAELFQLIIIIVISVAAAYIFQNTHMTPFVGDVSAYRYAIYGMTIVFSYVCISRYNKFIAFLLPLVLSFLAISPLYLEIMEIFPTFVSVFAILMGMTTIVLAPEAKGRGFFEFLMALILPSLLTESRALNFSHFITTSGGITYYEILAVTVAVVAGYFYLRHAALRNLTRRDFLSKGEIRENANVVDQWTDLISGMVIAGAAGIVVFLAIVTPIVADTLQYLFKAQPLFMFALAVCLGIIVVAVLLAFQIQARYMREPSS